MAAHIAVDVRLARSSGHRTYIRNLLPRLGALEPTWHWTLLGDSRWLQREDWARFPNARAQQCGAPVYSVGEQIELPLRIPRGADLYWATHYNVPLLARTPLVLTVHDLAHLRLSEYRRSAARRGYARFMFQAARRRAVGLICDSDFTRRELEELLGSRGAPPTVIPLGVDAFWFEKGNDSPAVKPPYFLFVGNLKPHKNLRALLVAMAMLPVDVRERLVIAGKMDGLRTPDAALLNRVAALKERAIVMGDVSDAQLRALMRHATALVVPSLYEGFGLPPLEAMAAECPSLVSRSGSLSEVCGDASMYFDAGDDAQLAGCLGELARDSGVRDRLIGRGRERARELNWDTTASRTLSVLRQALDLRS